MRLIKILLFILLTYNGYSQNIGIRQVRGLTTKLNATLNSAGLGLKKSGQSVLLDTSYGKKYFTYGLLVPNDSTVTVDSNTMATRSRVKFVADSLGALIGGSAGGQWTTTGSDIYNTLGGSVGIGTSAAPSSKLHVIYNGVGVISPTASISNPMGMTLENSTAATSTAQQYSPMLRFRGNGWKTNATASSQTVDWRMYGATSSGAVNPGSGLYFDVSTNGSAYANQMQISSAGTLTLAGGISASGNVGGASISTNSTGQFNTSKAPGTTGSDGLLMNNSVTATSSVPVQYSPRIRWISNAWNGTTNIYNEFISEARGISGTTVTKANLVFGNRTSTTATGSFLDVFSISGTGGVILNPMTKATRDALPTPEQGRMVFVSDNGGYLSIYNAGWFKVNVTAD